MVSNATRDQNELGDRLGRVMNKRIEGLSRLTGGASRETWSFDAVDPTSGARQELILRRDPPGAPRGQMELEARLLRAAASAGVPVPTVRAAGAAGSNRMDTSYMVMDRIAGETIARRILRDPQYVTARTGLANDCGQALAKLHSIDPKSIVGLETLDPVSRYRTMYSDLNQPVETFDMAFAWLEANRPASRPTTLVHGDFRLGNLIVRADGLASVLDWELAHAGDPMEDLAWLCIRAWRFGGEHPVAGVGSFDDLFRSYEGAGGTVDQQAFDWWLVAGTLIWGVMCIMQTNAHLSGAVRSIELAAIGRRVVEQEHDLLLLLRPVELAAAKLRSTPIPDRRADTPDAYGLPSAATLVDSVREFLEADVMTSTDGRVQFHARVAANALAIVERQLRAIPLAGTLEDQVVARLAVANPKYTTN